jgi:acyl-CoA oxidase
MATWHKADALQLARECCGGQGFSLYNRIAAMRADSDVDLTYEGGVCDRPAHSPSTR